MTLTRWSLLIAAVFGLSAVAVLGAAASNGVTEDSSIPAYQSELSIDFGE